MRRLSAFLAAAFVFTACFGDARETTETGKGFPELSVELPASVQARSEFTAELRVSNPGPGDMDGVTVAFAPIGPAQGENELPNQLVGFSSEDGENPSVISIDPEPRSVGQGGVLYTFDGLAEGESVTINFTLRAPVVPGTAANSVQVYDSVEVARARGLRLQTVVER